MKTIVEWRPRRGQKSKMARDLGLVPATVTRVLRHAEAGKATKHSSLVAEYIRFNYQGREDERLAQAVEVAVQALRSLDAPVKLTTAVKLVRVVDPLLLSLPDDKVKRAILARSASIQEMFTGETYVVFPYPTNVG